MNALRRATYLARLALAWFVLALGAAIAAPLVHPQGMALVCSAAGTVKLVQTGNDSDGLTGHLLDCPLCLVGKHSAPPSSLHVCAAPAQSLSFALRPVASAHTPSRSAAALPARGPPAIS